MAGTKRSCCNRFCCFSSSASDEEGQDHRASAGPGSLPSAIDNTTETLPGPPITGPSNVVTPRKDEIEQHVDPNLDASRTHQCDKAPLSESQNTLRKSEGEDVNAHPSVSGATQCDEPSSSGSSNLSVKSEGEHVDVNPNVPEAPLSSSSTGVTKSEGIRRIKHIEQADVNLDELVDHISQILKLREEEMLQPQKASNPSNFPCPEVSGFKKLNAILSWGRDTFSWGTDLKNLNEILSSASDFASKLKDVISGPVKAILKDIGQASVVTSGLLVVAYTLERFQDLSDNKDGCWVLIKEMSQLASIVKGLNESGKGTSSVIEEATTLVVEGAITCCTQLSHSGWKSFLLASEDKADLSGITEKLNRMYFKISVDIGIRNLTAIERLLAAMEPNRNRPVCRIYPDHAVGIEESIKEVLSLLECESAQNAVTVILHGFGGMGKTTLADAVSSHIGGCRYSHVQLFENIYSKPNIIKLQKKILKDLMEPEEPVPDIRKYEDGHRELGERLEKIEAFIYIDNVLEGAKLKELLPQDMSTAKKMRLLLTARNEDVKYSCPRPCTEPKIYKMEGIQHQEALIILQREIKDGINDDQFNDIIHTCGGIPLMLTLAAPFIGSAKNKGQAYFTLLVQKNKLWSQDFMRMDYMDYAFSYDGLPQPYKNAFLHICTNYNGWKWDRVEDTVGKDVLRMLKSKALVSKTTNGFASVHDVILAEVLLRNEDLSYTYPRHAVGIEKPIEQVYSHLEIQSDDQNAVTVILHGFGGMGKTTLADAVFSEIAGQGMGVIATAGSWKINGGKLSKVRLFNGIKSTPDITALQKQILKDLMEPGETIPEIRTHKDGQQALEGVLRKINAFIYIDNVLKADALEELLPQNMTTAKKVRLLLTAREIKDVEEACLKASTKAKRYDMKEILREDAMTILKSQIEEGVTETQFSEIIQICGGIPLMLTLAAAFIRRADNKEEAYATLMEQKDKWESEDFEEMRYAFAYDALPQPCKDPFLDICTYFNGWNWDIVKDIVGDDALIMLKSRALVTRTTNGFASVHDVILTLARQISKEESKDKEVRCKFTNASDLEKFLEEGTLKELEASG